MEFGDEVLVPDDDGRAVGAVREREGGRERAHVRRPRRQPPPDEALQVLQVHLRRLLMAVVLHVLPVADQGVEWVAYDIDVPAHPVPLPGLGVVRVVDVSQAERAVREVEEVVLEQQRVRLCELPAQAGAVQRHVAVVGAGEHAGGVLQQLAQHRVAAAGERDEEGGRGRDGYVGGGGGGGGEGGGGRRRGGWVRGGGEGEAGGGVR